MHYRISLRTSLDRIPNQSISIPNKPAIINMITNSERTVVKKWPRPYIQRDNSQQMAKINKVVTKYNDNGDVSTLLLLTSCNKFCMRKMDP